MKTSFYEVMKKYGWKAENNILFASLFAWAILTVIAVFVGLRGYSNEMLLSYLQAFLIFWSIILAIIGLIHLALVISINKLRKIRIMQEQKHIKFITID